MKSDEFVIISIVLTFCKAYISVQRLMFHFFLRHNERKRLVRLRYILSRFNGDIHTSVKMAKHLDDKIKGFIECQRKQSTVQATLCHINKLNKFLLTEKEELRPIHEIEPVKLDQYLSEFFMDLKMPDGSEYEPVTIQSIKCAIERRLREEYYPATISDSLEFNKTRQVLSAKMKYLKKGDLEGKNMPVSVSQRMTRIYLKKKSSLEWQHLNH